jgi:hypothetical protein
MLSLAQHDISGSLSINLGLEIARRIFSLMGTPDIVLDLHDRVVKCLARFLSTINFKLLCQLLWDKSLLHYSCTSPVTYPLCGAHFAIVE